MTPTELTGGCVCGAVRYGLKSAPTDAGYCHCEQCRRSSGAPVLAFATVPLEDLVWLHGRPRRRRSTATGERSFCGDCGTQLTIQVEHQPSTIDFTIGSLDVPAAVVPGFHLFRSEAISWFDTADKAPRHEKLRPDTLGLPAGQVELGPR